jgi:hypothetical protein
MMAKSCGLSHRTGILIHPAHATETRP